MINSPIELDVDVANNDTIVEQVLVNAGPDTINRSTFEFSGTHSLVARDIVQFYRTYPKRSGQSRGSAKCAMKFTTDIAVNNSDGSGDIVLPLIGEVSFSLPVGVTPAQTMSLRQRIVSLLDLDDVAAKLMDLLHI